MRDKGMPTIGTAEPATEFLYLAALDTKRYKARADLNKLNHVVYKQEFKQTPTTVSDTKLAGPYSIDLTETGITGITIRAARKSTLTEPTDI